MKRCYICEKGVLEKKNVDYNLFGKPIGTFQAEVCPSCKEQFFDEETSDAITAATKKKGLWGLRAKTKVGQSGDSLDVRIAKPIADFLKLKKGEEVTVYPENQRKIVIELA